MAVAPVQGPQPGSLSPQVLHEKAVGELTKIAKLSEQLGGTAIPINKIPDKPTRQRLLVTVGSELNVTGRKAELTEIAHQLTQATRQAGKSLAASTKKILNAKAEILNAIGEIELGIASGRVSIDAAFAKKADKIIRATIAIAESGGLEDKKVAVDNIEALKQFQTVPSVALALAKNAARVTKIEAELNNPVLSPFLAAAASLPRYDKQGGRGGDLTGGPPDKKQKGFNKAFSA